ncbi:MAG: hypothetical protein KDA96_09610 [Planctomycetaceae bacterium]|nr:hypothetical protein [Planctomycetaceae bacterium]
MLLTPAVDLLVDINQQPAYSMLGTDDTLGSGPVSVGDRTFFVTTSSRGDSLWVTEGTKASTVRITGSASEELTGVSELTVVGDVVFFRASDHANKWQLWRTDGTPSGTTIVAVNSPGYRYPSSLASWNGRLVYLDSNSSLREDVFVSDGTTAGTVAMSSVRDAMPVGSSMTSVVPLKNQLVITVQNESTSSLWISDGTGRGTHQLRSTDNGRFLTVPSASEAKIFFKLYGENITNELWVTDGTEAGTLPVVPTGSDVPVSGVQLPHPGLDGVFFEGRVGTEKAGVWYSNGTASGTVPVETIFSRSVYRGGTDVRGHFAFWLPFRNSIWVSDGTESGTVSKPLPPDLANHLLTLSSAGERLFAVSVGADQQERLIISDDLGDTWQFVQLFPQRQIDHLTAMESATGNSVVFTAQYADYGTEIWSSNGTPQGTHVLGDLTPGTADGNPSALLSIGNRLFVGAGDSASRFSDRVLAIDRGFQLSTLWIRPDSRVNQFLATDSAVFGISRASLQNNLVQWKDGRIFPLSDLLPELNTWADLHGAVQLPDDRIVLLTRTDSEVSLWVTDGTIAGTRKLSSSGPTSQFSHAIVQTEEFAFASIEMDDSVELWRTDGTVAGTIRLSVQSNPGHSLTELTMARDRVIWDTPAGSLISDGNVAGTSFLRDPTGQVLRQSRMVSFVETNGDVILSGHPPEGGFRYWLLHQGQATAATAWDIATGDITALDGAAQFDLPLAFQSTGTGINLLRITPSGDNVVTLAQLGQFSVADHDVAVESGGRIFFTGVNLDSGETEMWVTDGTSAGTRSLNPLLPEDLKVTLQTPLAGFDEGIAFSAFRPDVGVELFHLQLEPTFPEMQSLRLDASDGQLSWNDVPGAVEYEVWIQPLSGTDRTALRQRTPIAQLNELPERLRGHALRIWIRSVGFLGDTSAWSGSRDVLFGATPRLNRIGILSDDVVPALTWTASPDAVSHEIWISSQSRRVRVGYQQDLSVTQHQLDSALPPGVYLAWVRSRNADGSLTDWSPAERFQVFAKPVVLTSPAGSTADATPVLSWGSVPNATGYEVYVTSSGAAPFYRKTGVQTNSHRVESPLPAGEWRVWIRATFADGIFSFWGPGQVIGIGPSPVMTAVNRRLSWNPVTAATHYELWVDYLGGTASARQRILHDAFMTATSLTVPGNLPQGQYRAWVRAIRAESGDLYRGFWSAAVEFSVS